ncbi:MBL fold metallo-hydrolase [Pseudobacteriovorax antillogorgiicola]|uniref:Phosphoribosyl 1,2-cyclic phosphate phosphodiesterase n=1 Tax=Pseudobacteriovorax antillogorgiicola TaxID=1513793 RepID=A0A1Y6B6P3_9BACT|nr:MBL fold metallo-hydrolase [Pseudobacteriovorax antillogorgiicola]TCS59469.1 phosphoribosyl 1,2-cyclic phosphate phosphodiesterase [Pseudobacteriovorax antillogorgiicola]SME88068.1 phosphoribosyl 1,2-cyclic phosphate phosphodiesterase [Pseudobacteriovorax antillogorgiicola]
MRVHILGSGTSAGVPVIGCHCEVCQSTEPKNKRTRASIAVEVDGKTILIDTAPEMRLQVVRQGIEAIDAVFYTHMHADHAHGFDDLRAFWFHSKSVLPLYLMPEYEEELKTRFSYAFQDTGYRGAVPQVDVRIIDGDFDFQGLKIETARLHHGSVDSCAFKIGRFAYATDFKKFSEEQIESWRGKIDVMVASGIHFGEHYTHSVIPETLKLFEDLGVKAGYISHLAHEVEYLRDSERLPSFASLTYDGMIIDL